MPARQSLAMQVAAPGREGGVSRTDDLRDERWNNPWKPSGCHRFLDGNP